jgi:hypothetical protein
VVSGSLSTGRAFNGKNMRCIEPYPWNVWYLDVFSEIVVIQIELITTFRALKMKPWHELSIGDAIY